jgi:hypothetical protein
VDLLKIGIDGHIEASVFKQSADLDGEWDARVKRKVLVLCRIDPVRG